MRKLLFIMIMVLSFTGCIKNSSDVNETTEKESISKEDLITLVYGTTIVDQILLNSDNLDAINEYLLESGCNYQIKPVNLTNENPRTTTKEYVESIKSYMAEGNALDICLLASMFDSAWINSYDILRKEGYLEDLTPYINSQQGKVLKESMPEVQWESLTIDGGIYGLNGYIYTTQPGVTYVVSKELMDKYDLSEKDLNKPLSQLVPLLEKIQKEEQTQNADFACVNYKCNFSSCDFSKLYPVDGYVYGICLDENNEKNPVTYILEDEELIGLLKEMYTIYSNKDIVVTTNSKVVYENNFLTVFTSGLLWKNEIDADGLYVNSNNQIISSENLELFYPYDSDICISDAVSANAIMKDSKQKEAAFDFLSKMYSDENLINLMLYGANHVVENGYAYEVNSVGEKKISTSLYASWIRGNGFVSASLAFEPANKREQIFEIYDTYGYVSPYAGFRFDRSEYQELVSSTNQVIKKLSKLFSGEVTDFDFYIEELRSEFKEAGGEELYNAVKEQWINYNK